MQTEPMYADVLRIAILRGRRGGGRLRRSPVETEGEGREVEGVACWWVCGVCRSVCGD